MIIINYFNSADSFDHLEFWLNEIKIQANPDIKVFMIGNKADLEEKRKVDKEKANKFYEENNLHFFMETSAKTGFNAKEVFIEAAKCLYNEHLKSKEKIYTRAKIPTNNSPSPKAVKLPTPQLIPRTINDDDGNSTQKKKGGGCC